MTIAMNGTVGAQAVPATTHPSASRLNTLAAQITGIAFPHITDWCIAVGKSSTLPTTLASLAAPLLNSDADGWANQTKRLVGSTITTAITLADFDLSSFTAGDHLWLCFFNLASPISSTPVAAAVDLGLLAA